MLVIDDLHEIFAKVKPVELVSSDLLDAFDSITHEILLKSMQMNGFDHTSQIQLYHYHVFVITACSSSVPHAWICPRTGAVSLYESPVAGVLASFGACHHFYADIINIVNTFSANINSLTHRASYLSDP